LSTLLIKNADVLLTMNETRQEIKHGAVLVEENQITWVGPDADFDSWLAKTRPDLIQTGLERIIGRTPPLFTSLPSLWI